MFVDSLRAKKWCPHLSRTLVAFSNCDKRFTLGLGFVYPFYHVVNGVLKICGRFYCSLTCLCISEPPFNEEEL